MKLIVYSQITEKTLNTSLGMPEYSYYFVLKGFLPVLREVGEVVIVEKPEQEVDPIYEKCSQLGESCLFISFSPPNKAVVDLKCPTLCIIAWEFDRIPDEVWDNDPKNDWRFVFSKHGQVITLSQYAADAVRKAMGRDFPVASIPVPVWDSFEAYRNKNKTDVSSKKTVFYFDGNIIDSRNYHITSDSFMLQTPVKNIQIQNWNGETLSLGFTSGDEFHAYFGGGYESEPWGTWSRTAQPWVVLPFRLNGIVHMKIKARGYGHNSNKEISVSLGNEKKKIRLKKRFTEQIVTFKLSSEENLLKFSDLDLTPLEGGEDPRSMGIGLSHIEISGQPLAENDLGRDNIEDSKCLNPVCLEGVVYTTVFNPMDERKNWKDIIKAFIMAFHDTQDATLVLKITHHSLSSFLGAFHYLLQQLGAFKCRIIGLHGYLDATAYEKLIKTTHFYVNASKCEGLCLPLMEYMSCSKPSIATHNTSLLDFVSSKTTLIVESAIEPCIWPHDPRHVFRTVKYRIDFQSLVNAFKESYDIAKHQPDRYNAMSLAASSGMEAYASKNVVKSQLQTFFNKFMK